MKTTVHDPLEFDVIGSGLGCPEGPVICDDGSVLCVDIDSGRILRIEDGVISTVAKPGGGPNGLAIGPDGLGYVANNGGFLWTEVGGIRLPMDLATHSNEPPGFEGGWIESVDLSTGAVTVLARACGAKRLTGPNDLVFDEVGGLWLPTTASFVPTMSTAVGCTTCHRAVRSRRSPTRCSGQMEWVCRRTAARSMSRRP